MAGSRCFSTILRGLLILQDLAGTLRQLRRAQGLTQADVARLAGMSRPGYRRIESSESTPRPSTLKKIAAALGVDLQLLLSVGSGLTNVRFRATRRIVKRDALLAEVAEWLETYARLEAQLGIDAVFELQGLADSVRGHVSLEEASAIAAQARQQLKLGETQAVENIRQVLERAGARLYTPAIASDAFFGLSLRDPARRPAIVVNTWDRISVERWIFTAAHELGHILLHDSAFDVSRSEEDQGEEREADVFASEFLMPSAAFWPRWHDLAGTTFVERVMSLKRQFRVSYKAVLFRLSDVPGSREFGNVWARFNAEYGEATGRSLRRTDEPDGLSSRYFLGRPEVKRADEPDHLAPADFVGDRLRQLACAALDAGHLDERDAQAILKVDAAGLRRILDVPRSSHTPG